MHGFRCLHGSWVTGEIEGWILPGVSWCFALVITVGGSKHKKVRGQTSWNVYIVACDSRTAPLSSAGLDLQYQTVCGKFGFMQCFAYLRWDWFTVHKMNCMFPPIISPEFGAPAPSPVSWRQQAESVSAHTCTRSAAVKRTPSHAPQYSIPLLSSLSLIHPAEIRSTRPLGVEGLSRSL